MLDRDTRAAVLRLRQEGHGTRTIADALNISRHAVRHVLEQGEPTPPRIARETVYDAHLDRIRALYVTCRGNLVVESGKSGGFDPESLAGG